VLFAQGGVGKTTTAASIAYGLAERGHKTCVIDFDIGLRNLDIHLGCERRVIFDFVNVSFVTLVLSTELMKGSQAKINAVGSTSYICVAARVRNCQTALCCQTHS
jgi:septum formation inhibitor-activating ATPase MinD